jgi:hypothetical protein
VVSCARATGAKTSMANRANVARKITFFIQSSFCSPYLPSTALPLMMEGVQRNRFSVFVNLSL